MPEKRKIPPGNLHRVEKELLKARAPAKFVPKLAVEFGLSERQVWTYVSIARKRLAERLKDQYPEVDREIAKSMLLSAYRTAKRGTTRTTTAGIEINEPDASTMVQAAKVYAEVTGAMAPQKVNHKHDLEDGIANLLGEALKDGNPK